MIDLPLVTELNLYVPERQRSDFINQTLEWALTEKKRELAAEKMKILRKKANLSLTPQEIRKLRHEGLL